MSNFKIGDTVILEKYQKGEGESQDWALKEGIPLNTPLTIVGITYNSRNAQ